MSDAKELLPCPFCGGPPQILSGGAGCHYIRCEACSCTSDDRARDKAIAAWNRRAAEPRNDVKHALEKLIAHLDGCPRREIAAGGMTIDAQIRRTRISNVEAWEVEEARDALAPTESN